MDVSRGVDVSHHQGRVDWAKLTREHSLTWAAAKATEGETYRDSQFPRNWSAMKAAGLVRVAYHFAHPGSSVAAQAKFFLDTVKPVKGDVLCLDLEQSDGRNQSQVNSWAKAFGAALRRGAPGCTTVIYLGGYAANGSGKNLSKSFDYWWYPRYATMQPVTVWPSTYAPRLSGNTTGWKSPHVWQWACSLSTSQGHVDANISPLSAAALRDGPGNAQEDDMYVDDISDKAAQKIALWNWRYDQQGKKPQAWGLLQAAAQPVVPPTGGQTPVVTTDQLKEALREVLKEMLA